MIAGSGPAGLTAAIYASRAKLDTTLILGINVGGQLLLTSEVEDYPGFPTGILGPDLIGRMRAQAEKFGAKIIDGNVEKVDFSQKQFTLWADGQKIEAETVVIATGSSAKWLGLPSEQRLIGRGVSACAVCDAAFFRNQKVGVVGGGDAAMREALFLARFAKEVFVIHRRDQLRAFKILQEKAKKNPKISFLFNKIVGEVLGKERVEGVILEDTKTKEISKFSLDGLFVAIGHQPNTGFLEGQVELDEKGYIKIIQNSKCKMQNEKGEVIGNKFSTMTSSEGIFAAGDVADWRYRQAVTAAGSGCQAALDAQEYLEDL